MIELIVAITTKILDQIWRKPIGRQFSIAVVYATVAFLVFYSLETDSKVLQVLRNTWFRVTLIVGATIWVGLLMWRTKRRNYVRLILVLLVVVPSGAVCYFLVRQEFAPIIQVQVFVHDSGTLSGAEIARLQRIFRGSMYAVSIHDVPISLGAPIESLTPSEIRKATLESEVVRNSTTATSTIPVLITSDVLNGVKWRNLLSLTFADLVVLSTKGVDSSDPGSTVVQKYLATSIVVEVLAARVKVKGLTLFGAREPGQNSGCLRDFHRTRESYIEMTQSPALCESEKKDIVRFFGGKRLESIDSLLERIREYR